MTGVSLVITTDPPEPVVPAKVYVLRMDEEHAEFLFSLVRKVQVLWKAGELSYDIYIALSGGKVPFKEVGFRHIDALGSIEVKYTDE